MKKNPKSEIRNPKSDRRGPEESQLPKTESVDTRATVGSDGWSWGDKIATEPLVLWEGGGSAPGLPGLKGGEGRAPEPLDERTARFGEEIIRFAKKIPQNPVNNRLITQLVGAGTSIGANYCEADDSVSGKEFKLKIGTCRKESKETMFFLRMIATAEEGLAPEARRLWREAKELNLIFGAIWRK